MRGGSSGAVQCAGRRCKGDCWSESRRGRVVLNVEAGGSEQGWVKGVGVGVRVHVVLVLELAAQAALPGGMPFVAAAAGQRALQLRREFMALLSFVTLLVFGRAAASDGNRPPQHAGGLLARLLEQGHLAARSGRRGQGERAVGERAEGSEVRPAWPCLQLPALCTSLAAHLPAAALPTHTCR